MLGASRIFWLIGGLWLVSGGYAQIRRYWEAPDRGAKVAALIPGRKIPSLTRENLFRDYVAEKMALWAKDHPALPPEEAYAQYAATPPTDEEIRKEFPRHIAPWARVRSGRADPLKVEAALNKYCPFCGSWSFGLQYEPTNWYIATTTCCGRKLYGRVEEMSPDYPLRPTAKVPFQHLDETMYEDTATIFRDAEGVEWELFIRTMMDCRRWLQQGCDLVVQLAKQFDATGDPCAVHKIAVILDLVADTYYGLPLVANNTVATYEGQPLTREAWQRVPQPGIFELTPLGPWNRRTPFFNRGWLNMSKEHIWIGPFARVRHHPAFKAVSQKLYGDPEALDRKILHKLVADLALMFRTAFSQKLLTNYQEANYVDLWLLGILAEDKLLQDFAGPAQEVVLYNHTYQDGLNGEGAPNYMAMPGSYFLPFLSDPKGWLQYYPNFLQEHPFYEAANSEWQKLTTVRGLFVEFGDQHEYVFPSGFRTDENAVRAAEQIGSRNWAGYGVGILRFGGPGHRQEMCLSYSRASLHNAQDALGLDCWFDGVPILRRGGYAAYWCNAPLQWTRPSFKALKQMGYPQEIAEGGRPPDNWSWDYCHSPLCQGNMTIDEIGTGPGWDDNRGYGEVITFKGGEPAGAPGSGFQILDVKDHYSWARRDKHIDEYRRCVIGVSGPDGRPYAVDVLLCAGEGRQALYQSAFGESVAEELPQTVREAATLKDYYFGNQSVEPTPEIRAYSVVRKVRVLASPRQPWSITWKTDLGLYGPRDPQGKAYQRPWPDDVGCAYLRMIGLPPETAETGTNVELLRAKGPWIGWLRQPLPGGERVDGYVGFLDARDFIIERRLPPPGQRYLKSLYVRILEGFRAGEQSVIRSVRSLRVRGMSGLERQCVALELQLAGGHTDLIIFQSAPGAVHLSDGLDTDARYALLRRNATGEVIGCEIVRGTFLRAGNFQVKLPGDFTGEIVDVIGDLTGTRQESSLIIKPDKPWPEGEALAGRQLLVHIESALRDPCAEGYRIARVTPLPEGLIRVDLQDHAPFVVSWHQVTVLPPDQPNVLKTWRPLVDHGNSPWYQGLFVWFPERNKTFTIRRVNRVGGGYGGDTVEFVEPVNLAAEGLQEGDWFVVYGMRPGLKVNVANDFCLRREAATEWRQWTLASTGAATVEMADTVRGPLLYRSGEAWRLAPSGRTSFSSAETGGGPIVLMIGKPAWLNLEDREPPEITLELDGRPIALEQASHLGAIDSPRKLLALIRDRGNPLAMESLRLTLNGQPLPAACWQRQTEDEGKTLRLQIDLAQALAAHSERRVHRLTLTIADRALERNEARAEIVFAIRAPEEPGAVYLSDLPPVRVFAHGGLIRDKDYVGNPAQIGEMPYPKCLTMHPEAGPQGEYAEAIYELPPGQILFKADIGVSRSAGGQGSVEFIVQVGETLEGEFRTLYRSPILRGGESPLALVIPLPTAKYLRLVTTSAGDGINCDHALWGVARLVPKQ